MYAEGYSDGYAAGVRAAKLALRKPLPEKGKLSSATPAPIRCINSSCQNRRQQRDGYDRYSNNVG